ncbi:energy transducer TonB [Flavobacterium sp. F-65]|jgi:TonB family protein|uniref:Energy transducer TonB n=1 Tax=Flavobacterium pisciphilum TaxID=2893755 RepID=A0ABS8MTR3_9FLAO|nr:energy transducer TonB [Flavobacterium sp. F-65]MCC9072043.1 energy transducer TonB [Flavobacterium sp. F-65]
MTCKKESSIKEGFKMLSVGMIFIFLLLSFSTKANAQTVENKEQNELIEPFHRVEKQPEFPGGMRMFYKFFYAFFKMPNAAYENKISGKLLLRFTVEIDGSLSNIKIIKDLGYGLGEEAVRVLKRSIKWIPASDKGKAVPLQFSLPISIVYAE